MLKFLLDKLLEIMEVKFQVFFLNLRVGKRDENDNNDLREGKSGENDDNDSREGKSDENDDNDVREGKSDENDKNDLREGKSDENDDNDFEILRFILRKLLWQSYFSTEQKK